MKISSLNNLKIYKSSAGSGKTFTLVIEYLKLVLSHPEDYKSILAITFTNKAAGEMKNRIIEALVALSNDEKNSIRTILEDEFSNTDLTIRAGKALKNILHDYSSFSVSTIDSFFQRILRALANEIHLPINMQLEIEVDDAILDVTERLLKDVGTDKDLTEWLTELAYQKMDDEKGWNLENDIAVVAREFFKENRRDTKALARNEISIHFNRLKSLTGSFERKMKVSGEKVLAIIHNSGLEVSDFSFASGGVAGYFSKICTSSSSDNYLPGKRVTDAADDPEKWAAKKSPVRNQIIELAEKTLIPELLNILSFVEKEFKEYVTASVILNKIYLFGIVNDLQKKFTEYRNENNIILLSDTTRLLNDVIHESDAPFIYEKTGNRYKHLLIDEFQDTSLLQWMNLLPLIINALGSGFMTMVVGDAKQSIYRWRGGNMNLLLQGLFSDLKQFKSLMKEEILSVNYRSKKEIVNFNNNFFSTASRILNEEFEMNDFPALQLAYGHDILQETFIENDKGGYVKICFIESEENENGMLNGWKEKALDEMFTKIQQLKEKKYSYKDICILVRKNTDGNEIANWLFEKGIREIISPDSLLITASPRIRFLINIFLFLNDNKNTVAKSEIIYYYERYILKSDDEDLHRLFSDNKRRAPGKEKDKSGTSSLFEGLEKNVFNQLLPESFTAHLSYLGKLPVYELCEQLVSIFKLNDSPDAYIQRFLDLILDYTVKFDSTLEGFLHWWETASKAQNASVIIPGNTDAIRIMTIHGAKGLQFPVVIMPFTEWSLSPKTNETIWMDTTGSPFEEMGTVAVNSNSRLNQTYFSHEYVYEINQTVIDNLNLLYVAFTRAEDKLFVCCPADNENKLNSISKLIYRTCKKNRNEFTGEIFEMGLDETRVAAKEKKDAKIKTNVLASYPVSRWQDKLSLSTHSGDLLSILDDKQLEKINYGILVHSVLAEIRNLREVDKTVERIVFAGLIGEAEMEKLKNEIEEVLAIPEINKYFDESYMVLSEREIILPGGEIFRPDRVIIKNNKATVIDFKTGRRENKHHEQVAKYADILRSMNFDSVEGKLIYLGERVVVDI